MGRHDLRHLAVVAGPAPPGAADPGAIAAGCAQAAALARAAYAAVPGLVAFSWVEPDAGVPGRSAAALRAGAEGARLLAQTAASLGAAFRLCGHVEDLPRDAVPAPGPPGERVLLWFRRYSGRDEIVRAATRFFTAHPGRALGDDELDAWLDTAGVPDPDLLVYAGGPLEPRDVLLWQGSYAEIRHTDVPWESLSEADLRLAVADFIGRQRRFGR